VLIYIVVVKLMTYHGIYKARHSTHGAMSRKSYNFVMCLPYLWYLHPVTRYLREYGIDMVHVQKINRK